MSFRGFNNRRVLAIVVIAISILLAGIAIAIYNTYAKDVTERQDTQLANKATLDVTTDYKKRKNNVKTETALRQEAYQANVEMLKSTKLSDVQNVQTLIDTAIVSAQLNNPEAQAYAKRALNSMPTDKYTRQFYANLIVKLTSISTGDYSSVQ